MIIRSTGQGEDEYLRQAFSWLARIGACPKFGSRPIGWYQIHAYAALKHLESGKAAGFPVRCKHGMIQSKPTIGRWFDIINVRDLYDIAERAARS